PRLLDPLDYLHQDLAPAYADLQVCQAPLPAHNPPEQEPAALPAAPPTAPATIDI
ncbi:hypothetical protein BGZ59_006844, partial [Podila verticillata]